MKIIQIATGQYTYSSCNDNEEEIQATSHCIYALDEDGVVYKHFNQGNKWVPLLEKNTKHNN